MFHWFRKHTKDGLERPDPTPIEIPAQRPLTLAEQIARFTRDPAVRAHYQQAGVDTFDEADDFEVEDDDPTGLSTPYEHDFDHLSAQTRQDELNSGMVEDMPLDRKERVRERFRKKESHSEKSSDKS